MEDQTPGFLRRGTVQPITQQRYQQAARRFEDEAGRGLKAMTGAELDAAMAKYMETLYLRGETVMVARYALFGTMHVLDMVSRSPTTMPLSKKALKGYSRKAPEESRDPPCEEMVWLAADYQLRSLPGAMGGQAALLTLTAFDGYLRPTEALKLQTEDFFIAKRGRETHVSVVIAPATRGEPAKNRQFDDGYSLGGHGRQYLQELILKVVATRSSGERIFDTLSLAALEKNYREFCKAEGVKMSPHSLRHAGPSHDHYFNGMTLQDIQLRGRWQALDSCRRYAKPSRMLRQLAALSASQRLRAAAAAVEIPTQILRRLGLPIIGVADRRLGSSMRALKRSRSVRTAAPAPRRLPTSRKHKQS